MSVQTRILTIKLLEQMRNDTQLASAMKVKDGSYYKSEPTLKGKKAETPESEKDNH